MSRQDNEKINNFKSQHKKREVSLLTTEMRPRHAFEVAIKNLLKGKKNMVATKINITGSRN